VKKIGGPNKGRLGRPAVIYLGGLQLFFTVTTGVEKICHYLLISVTLVTSPLQSQGNHEILIKINFSVLCRYNTAQSNPIQI